MKNTPYGQQLEKPKLNHHAGDNPAVQQEIKRLTHDKKLLNTFLANGEYFSLCCTPNEQRHFPAEVALLPYIESKYNPFALSHAGATSLWQLMPGTASGHGITIDWWYDGQRNIVESTTAALDYLEFLNQSFEQKWPLALAAYDSGQGRIRKAVSYNQNHNISTDYWKLKLPKETQNYLPRLFALAEIIKSPAHYGVTLPPISPNVYLAPIEINYPLNIAKLAELTHIDEAELRQLNADTDDGPPTPWITIHFMCHSTSLANLKRSLPTIENN